ncbi:hypothetical protein HY004_02640 [Candidatus Saccharibacteria bacterium]|nr:hypothetical protein [Candidatus Saccharibacteria bacterium]
MARKVIPVIMALVAVLAINVSSASAAGSSEPQAVAAANGACGGGSSLKQMISGWKKHGVLDDVARSAGQTPGVDGSSSSIVKGGIVMVTVVKGGWVNNYTCRGGKFAPLKDGNGRPLRKYIPAGSRYYVPEKLAPAPCTKKRVKIGYEARCGNKQVGNLLVKRPCKKTPPKKPKPPTVIPPPSGSGCTVIVNGDNNGVAGCGNVVVCSILGKDITDSTVCSNYASCIAVQGNTWNSTQNVCSSSPPPPPPKCPDGRPIPPSGDCDRGPTGEIDASAAHMQVGGRHVQLYFIGDDPDGDNIVLDILLDAPAGTYVSGKTKVTHFSDPNRTCPSDQTCWEATLWSGNTPGDATVRGKFTGSDPNKPFVTEPVIIVVAPDQFPT